MLLTSYLLAF